MAADKKLTVPEALHKLYKGLNERVEAFAEECMKLRKAETALEKKSPPGFSEETMHKLKREHGEESAFKIAWAAYDKAHGKTPKHEKSEAKPDLKQFPSIGESYGEGSTKAAEVPKTVVAKKPKEPIWVSQDKHINKAAVTEGGMGDMASPPIAGGSQDGGMAMSEKSGKKMKKNYGNPSAYGPGGSSMPPPPGIMKAEPCKLCGVEGCDCSKAEALAKSPTKMDMNAKLDAYARSPKKLCKNCGMAKSLCKCMGAGMMTKNANMAMGPDHGSLDEDKPTKEVSRGDILDEGAGGEIKKENLLGKSEHDLLCECYFCEDIEAFAKSESLIKAEESDEGPTHYHATWHSPHGVYAQGVYSTSKKMRSAGDRHDNKYGAYLRREVRGYNPKTKKLYDKTPSEHTAANKPSSSPTSPSMNKAAADMTKGGMGGSTMPKPPGGNPPTPGMAKAGGGGGGVGGGIGGVGGMMGGIMGGTTSIVRRGLGEGGRGNSGPFKSEKMGKTSLLPGSHLNLKPVGGEKPASGGGFSLKPAAGLPTPDKGKLPMAQRIASKVPGPKLPGAGMGKKEEPMAKEHIGFNKLKEELSHEKGITNPGGIAYVAGVKKYGKAGMEAKAKAGKKK